MLSCFKIEDTNLKINERKLSSTQDDDIEITKTSDAQINESSQISISQKQLNNISIDSVTPVCPQRKIVEAEDLEEQRKKDRSALVGLLTVLNRGGIYKHLLQFIKPHI